MNLELLKAKERISWRRHQRTELFIVREEDLKESFEKTRNILKNFMKDCKWNEKNAENEKEKMDKKAVEDLKKLTRKEKKQKEGQIMEERKRIELMHFFFQHKINIWKALLTDSLKNIVDLEDVLKGFIKSGRNQHDITIHCFT